MMHALRTILDKELSDWAIEGAAVTMREAEQLFAFFQQHSLFRWSDAMNDCEDRANAICMLLDKWGISNYKAWIFAGNFHGGEPGYLQNCWNYHVAAALPVEEDGKRFACVIDPGTCPGPASPEAWSLASTEWGTSYYALKDARLYIFRPPLLVRNAWHPRDRRNFKWTMQGLAGINGVSAKGKAQLVFCKNRIRKTEADFRKLMFTPSPLGLKQAGPVAQNGDHAHPTHSQHYQPA